MALWQGSSRRSKTGRRIRYHRGKRKFEIGREELHTIIGPISVKRLRARSGNLKIRAKSTNIAYVTDPKTNKTTKAEIISVVDNPANIHYVRRNIITKGAIIETSLGKARVTSRPGQVGIVNAVLLSEES